MSNERLDDFLRQIPPRDQNEEFLMRVMAQVPIRRDRSTIVLSVGLLITCGAIAYFAPASILEDAYDKIVNFMGHPLEGGLSIAVIIFFWTIFECFRK